jgi:hypothetical protein
MLICKLLKNGGWEALTDKKHGNFRVKTGSKIFFQLPVLAVNNGRDRLFRQFGEQWFLCLGEGHILTQLRF